jgi:phosphoadenosine phosphosulfate reductase
MNNFPDLVTAAEDSRALAEINQELARLSAEQRVDWALNSLPQTQVLSSSFGAQAAVSLHLLSSRCPDLPVILIDTGYLFPETWRFVAELSERLKLNLNTYRAAITPTQMEEQYGPLWTQGREAIQFYNRIRKVEPMQRALEDLDARTWFTGIRRAQAQTRENIDFLELRDGRWKVHPLADWRDRDVWQYLQTHNLPYHPLWHDGYISIGDTHSTQPFAAGMREEDTRFSGLVRECGLHA